MSAPQSPELPRAESEKVLGAGKAGPLTVATTLLALIAARSCTLRSALPVWAVLLAVLLQAARRAAAAMAPRGSTEKSAGRRCNRDMEYLLVGGGRPTPYDLVSIQMGTLWLQIFNTRILLMMPRVVLRLSGHVQARRLPQS